MNLQKNWTNKRNDHHRASKLTKLLFIIYLIALFWILLFKFNVHGFKRLRSLNLIPYNAPLILNGKMDFGEIILNIMIFVPFGIYAEILFKRWTIAKKLLLIFLMSLIIETLQFIFRIGASDITDIINNTLGGLIGLTICKGIEKGFRNNVRAQKFINILATTGTTFMIALLLLLKLNHLWIFRMDTIHRR